MSEIEKVAFIIATINETEFYTPKQFNTSTLVRNAYLLLSDEESLRRDLGKDYLTVHNNFCNLNSMLMKYFEIKTGNLKVASLMINYLENYYDRNYNKIELVRFALKEKDIELAEEIANEIPDEEEGPGQYLAQRIILEYFAANGDIENFKSKMKSAKLGLFPRYGINKKYKFELIEGYARKNGIKQALKLLEEGLFKNVSAISAIKWAVSTLTINEIDEYLFANPRIEEQTDYARAQLYTEHFSTKVDVEIESSTFEKVFSEISKIDKNFKNGDYRLRGFLFMNFGASTLNKSYAEKCKKSIISPFAKKELNDFIKNLKS